MGVLVVGVEAAGAALHGDAGFDVHAAAAAACASGVYALDGDLGALASIGGGVDGNAGCDGAGGDLLPLTASGEDVDAVIDERRNVAIALGDGGLDDAVVEGPALAVVRKGDGGVYIDFFDLRQNVRGLLLG